MKVFFFALAILIGVSCGDVAAVAEDQVPMNIGVIVPLSGPIAEFGIAFKNGLQLATGEKSPNNCRFIFEDSQYDSKMALGAFRKVTEIDKAKIVYNFGGPTTEALAPIAEAQKVILFNSETEPSLSIGRKYVVRFNSPSEDLASALIHFLQRTDHHSIGIVRTDNQYINGIYRAFLKALPPTISTEEVAAFSPTDSDFRSIVSRLRTKKFDTIGVLLLGDQISLFFQQMNSQGLHLQTFSVDTLESKSRIAASGPAIEGAIFAANAVTESFREGYQKTFGNQAQIHWAAFGFDFGSMITANVCSSARNLSADDVLSALKSAHGKGANGDYHYVESAEGDKYFSFPTIIRRIKDGEVTTVEDK